MIVYGNGFIAKNLKKIKIQKKFILYAAGVSNSNSKNQKEYLREIKTFEEFKKNYDKKILIYISTLSTENKYLKKDKYVKNKIFIEKLIKKDIKKYIIVRLPQVIGKNNNKYTLTNNIYNSIKRKKSFILWRNSKRNLIDIDDIKIILGKYLSQNPKINSTLNIFNPNSTSVKYLLQIFEEILRKKIKIKVKNTINKNINLKKIKKTTQLPKYYYSKIMKKNYLKKTLIKYYK